MARIDLWGGEDHAGAISIGGLAQTWRKIMRNLQKIILASVLALGMTGAGVGIGFAAGPTSRPAAKPAERHPEIRRALNALRNAKTDLQAGAHDYKGHRVAA